MKIWDWFDIDDPNHLNAYITLQETGFWPKNFIPEYVKRPPGWQIVIQSKMADAYVKLRLDLIPK